MLKKDKYNLLIIATTLCFIISVVAYLFLPQSDVRQYMQILILFFGVTAFLSFFMSKMRQQRHLSQILHGMVKAQTKVLQDLEELKANTPPAAMTHKAHEAERDMLRTVILELAKARGESTEEVEIPEPMNKNTEIEEPGELVLLEDGDSEDEEVNFSTLDHQQLLLEVKEALKMDRIEVLLQPVVSLPQRKPRFYECFSRLRAEDNSILVPDNYLEVAEDEGLISAVDNALLFRCIQMVRKAKKRHVDIGFFCNVSASSLADEKFIDSFIEFIQANPELKPWLILEIREDALTSPNPKIQTALHKLSEINCSFSLDQLDSLDVDISQLRDLGVRFIKVNSDHLSGKESEEYNKLQSIRRKLEKLRIDVIATKVENEDRVKDILDFNVDYGQGYLFSPPRISRI